MKKLLFTLLTISVLSAAVAQTSKCGIDTRALVEEEIAAGATTIDMLAKMAPGFDRATFEKAGIVFGAQAGQIVTMSVPEASLPLLDHSKEVLLYSISHRIAAPTCNDMRFDTRTDSVHQGLGVDGDTSFNGAGVYIGITDWGFDYMHINYNNYGKPNWRLDKAWDHFRLAGPAPEGFTYGTEISGHEALFAAGGDTSNLYGYGTHGTHVAGIAAGKGYNGEYTGQAPGAHLLFCSFGLGESQWMDGVAWMKRVAQDSARRLVVNSSWGMYSFSCLDGHSLLSEAINAWSDEGVVFCTSAGNNGDNNFHISRTFSGAQDTLKTVATYFGSSEGVGQALIMWGEEGHDFEACFRMQRDSVVWTSPMYSTAILDSVVRDTLWCGDIPIPYRVMMEHANPFDQRPHMQMDVGRDFNLQLQLFITATDGTVHAWNVANKQNHAGNEGCDFVSGSRPGFSTGNPEYGIGEPACAAKTISVAAHHADRHNNDTTVYYPGNLAYFSSYGPLISGVSKPEISAPGYEVVSSISSFTTGNYPAYLSKNFQGRTYIWAAMSGTSMSSPSTTGVVALMLQANPLLTIDQVRDIIKITARNDEKTGNILASGVSDLRWGWGKIDALRAVNEAMRRVSIEQVEDLRLPLHIYPNPTTGQVTVKTNCGDLQPMTVYGMDGRRVMQAEVRDEVTLDVSQWTKGVYVVRVGSRTEKLIVR